MALKIANMLNEIFLTECEEQNLRQILYGEYFDLPLTRYQASVSQCLFSKYEPRTAVFIISFFAISQKFVTILSIACCSQCCSALSAADKLLIAFPVLSIVLANSKAVATLVTTHISYSVSSALILFN